MEQELTKRAVYIQKIEGVWMGYMPVGHSGFVVNCRENTTLGDFVLNVEKDMAKVNIKPVFKCIHNIGLEEHLQKTQDIIRKFNDGRD